MINDLSTNKFIFDRVIVNNLRELGSPALIIKELDRKMERRMYFIDERDKPKLDNIYIACSIELPKAESVLIK